MRSLFDLPYKFLGILILSGLVLSSFGHIAEAKSPKQKSTPVENLEKVRRGEATLSRQEIKNIKNQGNPKVRYQANKALARQEGVEAVDELLADVQNDASAMVRLGAAQELGLYASETRVGLVLRNRLFQEQDDAVRYALARSLAFADPLIAVPTLERASRDNDPALRRQAAGSLKKFKNNEAKAILKKLKKDSDESVREAAQE